MERIYSKSRVQEDSMRLLAQLIGLSLLVSTLCTILILNSAFAKQSPEVSAEKDSGRAIWSTSDHSKYERLQKDFSSGPEVTRSCLSCHNEAGEQVQETIHWTWICPADEDRVMGKNGLTLNNF